MALYVFADIVFRIPISLDEVYKTTRDEIFETKRKNVPNYKNQNTSILISFWTTYARNKENEEIFVKAYSRLN